MNELPDVEWLVLEGGGPTGTAWETEARRRGLRAVRVAAEAWRRALLLDREQRDTAAAKRAAIRYARRVIEWSAAPRPTSLRHDAAEAILLGLWGAWQAGWLEELPRDVRGA